MLFLRRLFRAPAFRRVEKYRRISFQSRQVDPNEVHLNEFEFQDRCYVVRVEMRSCVYAKSNSDDNRSIELSE